MKVGRELDEQQYKAWLREHDPKHLVFVEHEEERMRQLDPRFLVDSRGQVEEREQQSET